MFLYLESLERGQAIFQLFNNQKILKQKIFKIMPDDLLEKVDAFVGGRRGFKKIQAIFVHTGPGSFSAVRSGVLLANTLAASLAKPLVPLKGEIDRATLYKKSATLLKKNKKQVTPIYNREPNITMKPGA